MLDNFLNSVSDGGENSWLSGFGGVLAGYGDKVINAEIDQKYSKPEPVVVSDAVNVPQGQNANIYTPMPMGQNTSNIMIGSVPVNKIALYIGGGALVLAGLVFTVKS